MLVSNIRKDGQLIGGCLMGKCNHILDTPRAESDRLLGILFDHQEERRFVYEHVWRPGDLMLWDNRCSLHAQTDFDQ